MLIIFILAGALMLYHLFGYTLVLKLVIPLQKQDTISSHNPEPAITVICPAYNEESTIREKLISFTQLDYPPEKILMIVISDGSRDRTESIVREFEAEHDNVRLIVQNPQRGKPSTHNLIESSLDTEWILATDANSIFDRASIRELVKYCHEKETGMIVGNLVYQSRSEDAGEMAYWDFESNLKELESALGTIICANGSIYLIRKKYFTRIHPASVDDFERTLIVLENRMNAVYVPGARVYEQVTPDIRELLVKKIRIISREWFALFRHIRLLDPFEHPRVSFQLFSHKLLRWLFPFLSLLTFISSYQLRAIPFFRLALIAQILVCVTGLAGLFIPVLKHLRAIRLCTYWLTMNLASLIAFFYFLAGKQIRSWEPERAKKK